MQILLRLLQEALQPALAAYEELKARGGRLDFLDLLIKARNLIRDNETVREELQKRFTHYFVDEFQDTDPIQAELLLLLAADNPQESNWLKVSPIPGKLFLVGDPKQSIYRFRRADIAIYLQVKQMLLSRGAEPLYLNTSFRSPPSLQSFVNAAFAPAMAGTDSGWRVCTAREMANGNHRKTDYRRVTYPAAVWRLREDRQLPNRRVSTRSHRCLYRLARE